MSCSFVRGRLRRLRSPGCEAEAMVWGWRGQGRMGVQETAASEGGRGRRGERARARTRLLQPRLPLLLVAWPRILLRRMGELGGQMRGTAGGGASAGGAGRRPRQLCCRALASTRVTPTPRQRRMHSAESEVCGRPGGGERRRACNFAGGRSVRRRPPPWRPAGGRRAAPLADAPIAAGSCGPPLSSCCPTCQPSRPTGRAARPKHAAGDGCLRSSKSSARSRESREEATNTYVCSLCPLARAPGGRGRRPAAPIPGRENQQGRRQEKIGPRPPPPIVQKSRTTVPPPLRATAERASGAAAHGTPRRRASTKRGKRALFFSCPRGEAGARQPPVWPS